MAATDNLSYLSVDEISFKSPPLNNLNFRDTNARWTNGTIPYIFWDDKDRYLYFLLNLKKQNFIKGS